jgi:hypothetical protein
MLYEKKVIISSFSHHNHCHHHYFLLHQQQYCGHYCKKLSVEDSTRLTTKTKNYLDPNDNNSYFSYILGLEGDIF